MNISKEMDVLSHKISSRAAQLNADVITTRTDPVITGLWHILCKYHRKAMVLCAGMGIEKSEICTKLERPQACINALHLSEEETCCVVFRRNLQARTKEKRKVKYFMSSPVVTIDPNSRIITALIIMKQHGIGSLVVIDGGKIKGILTKRDLVSKVFVSASGPDEFFVRDVMTPAPLITVEPETDIQKAAEIMTKNNVRHLPVIEKENLVGMLTVSDFYVEETTAPETFPI
ncbi:MAG: CBS domain-containing protein [archaeon]|nr:CBS domain-containing protein [archaeon]MCP8306551.1 CBS domain-containing protein [archaeon]